MTARGSERSIARPTTGEFHEGMNQSSSAGAVGGSSLGSDTPTPARVFLAFSQATFCVYSIINGI